MSENDELANKVMEEGKEAAKALAKRNKDLREVFSHIPNKNMVKSKHLNVDADYAPLIIQPNWNNFHYRCWEFGDTKENWLVEVTTTTQDQQDVYRFWFRKTGSVEVKPSKPTVLKYEKLDSDKLLDISGYRKNWFVVDNDYYELAHKKTEELFRDKEPKKEKSVKAKEQMKELFPKPEDKKLDYQLLTKADEYDLKKEEEDNEVIMGILEEEKVKILDNKQAIMEKDETQLPQLVLNMENIRNYIYRGKIPVTDQEIVMFLALCKKQNLDPFKRDVYLVKYSVDQPAQMIVSKDLFLKRANECKAYTGMDAGIIVEDKDGKEIIREGSRVKKEETLVGGYCKIEIKDKRHSYAEVSLSEYYKEKNKSWKNIPATMIRKVAIVQALREGFPDEFQGMYDDAEMIQGRED
jgi:phage recombination protein Bet